MILINNINELMDSYVLVEKPVDKEVASILNSESKKIILAGERKTGRTVVLRSMEKRGLNTKEQSIYCWHEGIIMHSIEPDGWFNKEAFDCYYELCFMKVINKYIRDNYPSIYEKYFKEDKGIKRYHSICKQFDSTFNNHLFGDEPFDIKLASKELSKGILDKFREIQELDRLNLLVDGFDRINGSSKYVQEIYQRYFDMFDKVVVTTDDKSINRRKLRKEGYDIRKIMYGNNKNVVKEIIERRVAAYEFEKHVRVGRKRFIDDSFISRLIQEMGTLGLSIEVVSEIIANLDFYKGRSFEEMTDYAIEEVKSSEEKNAKRLGKTKLYL